MIEKWEFKTDKPRVIKNSNDDIRCIISTGRFEKWDIDLVANGAIAPELEEFLQRGPFKVTVEVIDEN